MHVQPAILPLLDADGFLADWSTWNEEVAAILAAAAGLELDSCRLEVVLVLRDYFRKHGHSPAMRAMVSLVRRELGTGKGRSVYLLRLFPESPARVAARIAGLPRPEHCL